MSVLEPTLRIRPDRAAALTTPQPGRLRSPAGRRRGTAHEVFDLVAVGLNRWLDGFAWARSLHRRCLRQLEWRDVTWHVGAAAADLAGLRIAFLTDLHAGAYLGRDDLDRLFAEVAARRPDLILFGGDLINSRPDEIRLYDGPLQRLSAPLGVYAVAGNHDHYWADDIGAWQDFLEVRGVRVLANQGVRLGAGGASFWLAGVDDLTDGEPDVRRALWGRHPGEPTLCVAHQPDHFPELAAAGVDLVLSGHTHGGQIRAFGWAPICHSRHGFLDGGFGWPAGGSRLHVSRGVGVTILPLRLGARPEITLVEIAVR